MNFVVVHHHFRPGGVRRVIESALPHLVAALRPARVVLAGGEAPDPAWLARLRRGVHPVHVELRLEPSLAYWAERREPPTGAEERLDQFFAGLLAPGDRHVAWVHNPGLGRNLRVPRAISHAAARSGCQVVFHHHDWWFDNRWQRWGELRRQGFGSPRAVAEAVFPGSAVLHAAINQADARILQRHIRAAAWIPNPIERPPLPAKTAVAKARQWLTREVGASGPVWLLPARLLRRKNIAEALLLTRWLRPEAWLVTTGGPSSVDEMPYAERLALAAKAGGWPLRLSVLQGTERHHPDIPALMAAAEALVFTSIQEGFGLPYLEAAAAGRPLIARRLANVAPDLSRFGFRFPQSYREILVCPELFRWRDEARRQGRLFTQWRRQIPASLRTGLAPASRFQAGPEPVAFSRLTLTAQLEVLSRPPSESWARCAPLNPFLSSWRCRAAVGGLQVSPWPARSEAWLGGTAYARRFQRLLKTRPESCGGDPLELVKEFLRDKLLPENLYPLLWSPAS